MQGEEARGIARPDAHRRLLPCSARRAGALALIAAAAAVAAGIVFLAGAAPLAPLAAHMSAHIVWMNAVAPALVVAWALTTGAHSMRRVSGLELATATAVQIGLLWMAHAPTVMAAAAHARPGIPLIHGPLFLAAVWFWYAVVATPRSQYWRGLPAVAVTGKLFCLLGLLMAFAPNPLYVDLAAAHGLPEPSHATALADQQQAGLLMVAACPIVYGIAGLVVAALWLEAVSDGDDENPPAREPARRVSS